MSELVTNAVLHGIGTIELRMQADEHRVTGEVIDEGGGFACLMRKEGAPDDLGGWGLSIVGALAESWGVRAGATHVWFTIPVPG